MFSITFYLDYSSPNQPEIFKKVSEKEPGEFSQKKGLSLQILILPPQPPLPRPGTGRVAETKKKTLKSDSKGSFILENSWILSITSDLLAWSLKFILYFLKAAPLN